MIKRTISMLIVFCLLSLILPATADAQPPVTWEITLFDRETGSVTLVTSGGVFPLVTLPEIPALGDQIWRVHLTPDRHYLIFEVGGPTGGTDVFVADLNAQTCCRKLEDPLNAGLDIDWLGPISPDGTRVAVTTSSTSFYDSYNLTFTPLITIFDIATGNVVGSRAVSDLVSDYPVPVATFGPWRVDGLRVAPGCMGCEGVWQGTYQIWQPETNTLSAPTEPFDIFRYELPTTGEFIADSADAAFPASGAFMAYILPSNVVTYSPDAFSAPQVVYFRMENLHVDRAEWVVDGNAVIIFHAGPFTINANGLLVEQEPGPVFVIFRDGTQVPVTPPLKWTHFLAGLPDGWLTQDPDTDQITYYQAANGVVQSMVLGTAQGDVVGQNFALGTTASGAFPTVQPPAPVVCPGFMPSQLAPNSLAMVSPGPPNNLRTNPTTSAARVSEVPSNEIVIVLDGPVCADNMAWWQINYQGTVGWTAEGQGSDYWLTPNNGGF